MIWKRKGYAAGPLGSLALVVLIAASALAAGCGGAGAGAGTAGGGGVRAGDVTTVTMWHNQGGRKPDMMNILVDEFNRTVGQENGVIVSITTVLSTKEITEQLDMIRLGDPGAREMPDLVTVYPSVAMPLQEAGMLAPLDDLFTADELAKYQQQFLDEGRLSDGKLYVFPIAKSMEMLYLDQTLYDRYAEAEGVAPDALGTTEGIAETAKRYYAWTDARTPDVPNDGKALYAADSWFNFFAVGMAQLGVEDFIEPDHLNYGSNAFKHIWDTVVPTALAGGFAFSESYSSTLSVTGDILASTGSTAGIEYYGDTITYADNTTDTVVYTYHPYPVFRGATPIVLQRGAGMVVAKTDDAKERAAALFLKWYTDPAQNVRATLPAGYLPVQTGALGEGTPVIEEAEGLRDFDAFLSAIRQMEDGYTFTVAPQYEQLGALTDDFQTRLKAVVDEGRRRVMAGEDPDVVSDELYRAFVR